MKEKGITLIALVITVIVLLILAAVTIASLTGENGILSNADRAREQTEIAEIKERVQTDVLAKRSENQDGEVTNTQLKEILSKYFDNVPDSCTADTMLTAKKEYGGHEIKFSDIYNGDVKYEIPEGLEIGTIVSYDPDGTYTWRAEDYASSQIYDYDTGGYVDAEDVELDSSSTDFNISTWRVLDIDEGTGEITLVPSEETTGMVSLAGAQGYNNAVYLLNTACSELYGNEEKGIKARSIKIEDIEDKMTEEALQQVYNDYNYGEQVANAYIKSNSYYPSIYTKERLSVIEGTKNETGLGQSEQDQLISKNENGVTDGKLQAENIQPYNTHWYAGNYFMQTAFKSTGTETSYYELFMPKGNQTYYWLASRGVGARSGDCNFGVRDVYGGDVSADDLFNSNDNPYDEPFELFPVVSLSSELLEGDASTGFSVK